MYELDHKELARYIHSRLGIFRFAINIRFIHRIIDIETEYLVKKGIAFYK
jgi:hypothetical protein